MKNNNETGITLIALVVTIIVLLVFAGVTINLALGNQGIISRTQEAASKSKEETIKEEVSLAWNGVQIDGISKGWDINQKASKLGEEISAESVYAEGNNVRVVNYKGYDVIINTTNDAITLSESVVINFETIMAEAKANRQGYEAIGIGTDGELVDMNLWFYNAGSSANTLNLGTIGRIGSDSWGDVTGYRGDFVDGKIIGSIPQYIMPEGEEIYYPVTELRSTFSGCIQLKFAPEIPSTITNMDRTFNYCTNLISPPSIPNSVTNMSSTFNGCSSLTTAPIIPNSVTNMDYTFYECSSLTIAPEIPNSVTNMNWTYRDCINLRSSGEIKANEAVLYYTFSGCNNLNSTPVISGSVKSLYGVFSQCENLTNVSNFPAGVEDLQMTFYECSNLVSIPDTIPNSVTKMFRNVFWMQ